MCTALFSRAGESFNPSKPCTSSVANIPHPPTQEKKWETLISDCIACWSEIKLSFPKISAHHPVEKPASFRMLSFEIFLVHPTFGTPSIFSCEPNPHPQPKLISFHQNRIYSEMSKWGNVRKLRDIYPNLTLPFFNSFLSRFSLDQQRVIQTEGAYLHIRESVASVGQNLSNRCKKNPFFNHNKQHLLKSAGMRLQ